MDKKAATRSSEYPMIKPLPLGSGEVLLVRQSEPGGPITVITDPQVYQQHNLVLPTEGYLCTATGECIWKGSSHAPPEKKDDKP
jgi:hypothetical protein